MKHLEKEWQQAMQTAKVKGEQLEGDALRAAVKLTEYFKSLKGSEYALDLEKFDAAVSAAGSVLESYRTKGGETYDLFYKGLVSLRTYELKMKRRRVVLIPFKECHAGNFVAAVKGELFKSHESEFIPFEVRPGEYGYVRWRVSDDDILFEDSVNLQAKLAGLNCMSTLYIIGHCEPGSDALASEPTGKDADSGHWTREFITARQLRKMLKNKLNTGFPGKIKIFACNSACKSEENESFAEQFAAEMDENNYNCHIYGYKQEVKKVKLREKSAGSAKGFREIVRESVQGV